MGGRDRSRETKREGAARMRREPPERSAEACGSLETVCAGSASRPIYHCVNACSKSIPRLSRRDAGGARHAGASFCARAPRPQLTRGDVEGHDIAGRHSTLVLRVSRASLFDHRARRLGGGVGSSRSIGCRRQHERHGGDPDPARRGSLFDRLAHGFVRRAFDERAVHIHRHVARG